MASSRLVCADQRNATDQRTATLDWLADGLVIVAARIQPLSSTTTIGAPASLMARGHAAWTRLMSR
jgi:hypothetical protein